MNASVVGVAINGYCGKNEMRGSLHSAAHDKTVSGSGRDDDFLVWFEENKSNNKKQILFGDDKTRKATAIAKTTATAKTMARRF
jgi:hypothetical protein